MHLHIFKPLACKVGTVGICGVKDIAEQGLNVKFRKEVDWVIKIDQAESYIDGPVMKLSPAKINTRFAVTQEFPLVSVLVVIAPNPHSVSCVLILCVNSFFVN